MPREPPLPSAPSAPKYNLTAGMDLRRICVESDEEHRITITLPPELETRVAEKARAEGISAEAYVERVIREATEQAPRRILPLPLWPGRALSNLRREQLYEDVH